eukprot:TRINITY_DN6987_c0_g1_i1.p1 TRINITY_DN6987_c0_g1~~TRINITY_DN6987_c0_g1_i1.p1  ORF type:complete len:483 (+),score=49.03 TRINITY_DN6987_c0_g1_i1:84-1532(+)
MRGEKHQLLNSTGKMASEKQSAPARRSNSTTGFASLEHPMAVQIEIILEKSFKQREAAQTRKLRTQSSIKDKLPPSTSKRNADPAFATPRKEDSELFAPRSSKRKKVSESEYIPCVQKRSLCWSEMKGNQESLMIPLYEQRSPLNEVYELTNSTADEMKQNSIVLNFTMPPHLTEAKSFNMILTKHDLKTLDEKQLVNDNIILFYLKFLQSQSGFGERIYVYDTFFMSKLREFNENFSTREEFSLAYLAFRKWAKNVDVLSKDFLIFPIHDMEHWSLIIMCYPSKLLHAKPNDELGPRIVGFDSLEVIQRRSVDLIKMYIECEVRHKKVLTSEQRKSIETIPFVQMVVPKQNNLHDCGIYLLEYAESFLSNPRKVLRSSNRTWDLLRWFPKSIITKKRGLIKDLIGRLKKVGLIDASEEYLRKRKAIFKETEGNEKEFDKVDALAFSSFKANRGSPTHIKDITSGEVDVPAELKYYLHCHQK